MLKDIVVVTFAATYGSNIHRKYQDEFDKLYGNKFSAHIAWNETMLKDTEYYKNHLYLFNYKKYFGYFLWKPYIILNAFFYFENKKTILYCDSNIRFKDIDRFESRLDEWLGKQYLFIPKHDHYYNNQWTKRDAFVYMDADDESYHYANQRWSVLFAVTPTPFGIKFMKEYQLYCEIPAVVTEEPNICGLDNLPGFIEHRWEQSVLSILAERYGIDGPTDVEMLKYYDKVYTPEHIMYKEKVNANIS